MVRAHNISHHFEQGNSQKPNMDYCASWTDPTGGRAILVLADGMGGYGNEDAGAIASKTAVNAIIGYYQEAEGGDRWIAEAFERAAVNIRRRLAERPELQGMGTTAVVAWIEDYRLRVAHIGDSRATLFRPGDGRIGYVRLTTDHLALVENQGVPDNMAKRMEGSNRLSRYLGETAMPWDLNELPVGDGDFVVLTSDGITEYLDEIDTARILAAHPVGEVAQVIVRKAIASKSHDHCSAIVARIGTV